MSAHAHHHTESPVAHTAQRLGIQRADPTQTKTMRRQYGAQFYKRFRALKGAVREATIEQDVLQLRQRPENNQAAAGHAHDPDQPPASQPGQTPPPEPLPAPGIPGPLDPTPSVVPAPGVSWDARDYVAWYSAAQQQALYGDPSAGQAAEWSEPYINYAYEKGVRDADRRTAQLIADGGWEPGDRPSAGTTGRTGGPPGGTGGGGGGGLPGDFDSSVTASFDMPVHQRTIRALHRRNREGLDGINEATINAVRQELEAGVRAGWHPDKMARRINGRIDAIGVTRARTHARTVVIGSYNEAALRRYEQLMGSEAGVTVFAEFTTAKDDLVCEQCQALEGDVYSVREARGVIPVHPRCRCTWVPVPPSAVPEVFGQ